MTSFAVTPKLFFLKSKRRSSMLALVGDVYLGSASRLSFNSLTFPLPSPKVTSLTRQQVPADEGRCYVLSAAEKRTLKDSLVAKFGRKIASANAQVFEKDKKEPLPEAARAAMQAEYAREMYPSVSPQIRGVRVNISVSVLTFQGLRVRGFDRSKGRASSASNFLDGVPSCFSWRPSEPTSVVYRRQVLALASPLPKGF